MADFHTQKTAELSKKVADSETKVVDTEKVNPKLVNELKSDQVKSVEQTNDASARLATKPVSPSITAEEAFALEPSDLLSISNDSLSKVYQDVLPANVFFLKQTQPIHDCFDNLMKAGGYGVNDLQNLKVVLTLRKH